VTTKTGAAKPVFFATRAAFRKWLEKHHDKSRELIVGYYRKDSGRPSLTYPESVAEALCFGWIDGIKRRVDDLSYSLRFTPRQARSNWSAVNIAKMNELLANGLVHPAGQAAWERRKEDKSAYSYEQRHRVTLDAESEREFRRNATAWKHFQGLPPGYRRTTIWHIMSARRPETKAKRLANVIAASAAGTTMREILGGSGKPPSKPVRSRGRPRSV
jgi:uncharacterized protein YdeI (YjbR/CyaY-like superfamily)